MRASRITVALVAALTVLGVVLRLSLLGDSLVADELSTRWMITAGGLGDVIAKVYTDAEITPPLSFVLVVAHHAGRALQRARCGCRRCWPARPRSRSSTRSARGRSAPAPALLGGRAHHALALPALLLDRGPRLRADDRVPALLHATRCCARSRTGGRAGGSPSRVATCAAMYSHYTSVFPLAAQLAWALWAHPARAPAGARSRRAAAALAFLPGCPDCAAIIDPGDDGHPLARCSRSRRTTSARRSRTGCSATPTASTAPASRDLPGGPGPGRARRWRSRSARRASRLRVLRRAPRTGAGLVLSLVLAAAAPVGEALVSALGSNLLRDAQPRVVVAGAGPVPRRR